MAREMPTELDWAYLGGILDGEGLIALYTNGRRTGAGTYLLRVDVGNVDLPLIEWLQRTFGGSFRPNAVASTKRMVYVWVVQSRQATALLRSVRPYLKVKAAQADAALRYYDDAEARSSKGVYRLSAAEIERRHGIAVELKRLKRMV